MANLISSIKNKIIDKATEKFVVKKLEKPVIAESNKKLANSKVVLITTAGIHLKSQKTFKTKEGDPTFRNKVQRTHPFSKG